MKKGRKKSLVGYTNKNWNLYKSCIGSIITHDLIFGYKVPREDKANKKKVRITIEEI